MLDVPVLPSLVAVMVAEPVALAVTTPVDETVATAVLLDVHVTTRSVTTVLFASRTVATSVVTCVGTSVAVAGATVTLPTGTGTTVTVALPLLLPLVAEMVAVPVARAVTTPEADTVATDVLPEVHVMDASGTTAPEASLAVAVSVVVAPTWTLAADGCTVTLATGGLTTVTVLVADFPSLVAVMVAEPGATPV